MEPIDKNKSTLDALGEQIMLLYETLGNLSEYGEVSEVLVAAVQAQERLLFKSAVSRICGIEEDLVTDEYIDIAMRRLPTGGYDPERDIFWDGVRYMTDNELNHVLQPLIERDCKKREETDELLKQIRADNAQEEQEGPYVIPKEVTDHIKPQAIPNPVVIPKEFTPAVERLSEEPVRIPAEITKGIRPTVRIPAEITKGIRPTVRIPAEITKNIQLSPAEAVENNKDAKEEEKPQDRMVALFEYVMGLSARYDEPGLTDEEKKMIEQQTIETVRAVLADVLEVDVAEIPIESVRFVAFGHRAESVDENGTMTMYRIPYTEEEIHMMKQLILRPLTPNEYIGMLKEARGKVPVSDELRQMLEELKPAENDNTYDEAYQR